MIRSVFTSILLGYCHLFWQKLNLFEGNALKVDLNKFAHSIYFYLFTINLLLENFLTYHYNWIYNHNSFMHYIILSNNAIFGYFSRELFNRGIYDLEGFIQD